MISMCLSGFEPARLRGFTGRSITHLRHLSLCFKKGQKTTGEAFIVRLQQLPAGRI